MIRSSKHYFINANSNKVLNLNLFIGEYRRCLDYLINYVWNNEYTWVFKDEIKRFSIKDNLLDFPSMIRSDVIGKSGLETFLTGRSLKCCLNQVASMIKGETEKQRKRLYILNKRKFEGASKSSLKKLIKKIKQNIPVKPNVNNANLELCSICADFKLTDRGFDGFLRLKSITKTKLDIRLPINFHRAANKYKKVGKLLNSFLITKNYICLRWEIPEIEKKSEGIVVGADQGYKDILTLSNGVVTEKKDKHGHTLESILAKVCRKKKGSRNFKKAKDHQVNFVNYSINRLNLNDIKQINLEDVGGLPVAPRKLYHWQNTVIRSKMESKCEDLGIRLILQSSTYRSQRCSDCGNVRKSNRKGKEYSCKNCGNIIDADLNAAKNHEINLPDVPYELRRRNLNRGNGFFWLESGFFDFENRSLQSL